jgi:hypothetical protein
MAVPSAVVRFIRQNRLKLESESESELHYN